LDDVLRNAANEVNIPDMSSSWDGIASGLDTLQRRRKRKILFIWSFVGLMVLSTGAWMALRMNSMDPSVCQSEQKDPLKAPQINSPGNGGAKILYSDDASSGNDAEIKLNEVDQRASFEEVSQKDESESRSENVVETFSEQDKITESQNVEDAATGQFDENIVKAEEEIAKGHPEIKVDNDGGAADIETGNTNQEEAVSPDDPQDQATLPIAKKDDSHPKAERKGQESIDINGRKGWELSISASPGLAAKFVSEAIDFGWLVNKNYEKILDSESSAFSYQIDVGINQKLNDRIYWGTGLRYIERGERVRYDYTIDELVTVRTNENELLYTPLAPILHQEVNHDGYNRYQFIDVPLRIGLLTPIGNSDLIWRNEWSVNYSRLIAASGKKVNGTHLNLMDASDLRLNRNNIGWTAKTGLMWSKSDRVDWTIDALYNMNLLSLRAKEDGLVERPLNYGMNIGWNYKLFIK